MGRILDSIRSFMRRTPEAEEQPAPRFGVSVHARLLLSLSHADGPGKVIASTLNISASGLAVLVPDRYVDTRPVTEGSGLRITLDLHPFGTVEMDGLVARVEAAAGEQAPVHILGVKITHMSEDDRALYLQYIGTKGWESVLSGNDKL
jgi:PilZ domain